MVGSVICCAHVGCSCSLNIFIHWLKISIKLNFTKWHCCFSTHIHFENLYVVHIVKNIVFSSVVEPVYCLASFHFLRKVVDAMGFLIDRLCTMNLICEEAAKWDSLNVFLEAVVTLMECACFYSCNRILSQILYLSKKCSWRCWLSSW